MGVQGIQRDLSKNKKIRYLVTAVLICASATMLYTRFRDYTFNVTSSGKECSYTGQKNFAGEMHGSGTLTLSDGTTCSGEWKNGVLLSDGALTFPNGSRYEGEVDEKYLPKGSGTFYYKDEDKAPLSGENWTWIEGKTLDDDQHVINTQNKVFYTGMWLDNQYSGYGCRYTVNSEERIVTCYTGEFRKNYCYGEVTKSWLNYCEITLQYALDGEEDGNPDDTIYSTENVTFRYLNADCEPVTGSYQFVENEEITEGIFAGLGIIGSGTSINGELLAGSIYFYNGTDEAGNQEYSYYHGTFSGGNIVGKGKFEFVDGTSLYLDNVSWLNSQTRSNGVYTGMISNGKYVGFGIFKKDNGNTYCGEFSDGNFNGKGILTYAENDKSNRDKYEGSFVNSKREGKGTLTWNSGSVYNGSWSNDKRSEGKENHYNEDGTLCCIFDGQFKNGKYSDGTYKRYSDNGNLDYTYTGTYDENGKYSGEGTYCNYFDNGTLEYTYHGQFESNQRSGTGTLELSTGDTYSSESWKDGYIAEPGKAEVHKNADLYGGASHVDCRISLDGLDMIPWGTYTVGGGETVTVEAHSDSGIAFIGYFFSDPDNTTGTEYDDRVKDYDTALLEITLPDHPAGTELILYIEPVANNDTGDASLITKTGWLPIKLVYNH